MKPFSGISRSAILGRDLKLDEFNARLERKFVAQSARVLGEDQASLLVELAWKSEALADVHSLVRVAANSSASETQDAQTI